MTKTILVATDDSDHTEHAVAVAAALAGMYEAKMIPLHVLPDVVNEHTPEHLEKLVEFERPELGEALNTVGESIIHQAQRRARKQGANDIETVVTAGSPAKKIIEFADRSNADFIVMGSWGFRNLEGLLLGSVPHKVSHLAKQTCITVK